MTESTRHQVIRGILALWIAGPVGASAAASQGGMVIVSAGDPSAITSPNEQDQRHLSRFLYYPIFDPATPDDALRMTRFAST